MALSLRKLRIGKVDGKHEYLTPLSERDRTTFDVFLMPEVVEPERMHNRDVFFVSGFRGTGKTSLLRWHAEDKRRTNCITDFILFKSDLTETDRIHISKEVGISWTDVDSSKMEISQDFKSAWMWFILHKIGENIQNFPDSFAEDSKEAAKKVIRLLGLDDASILKKSLGFMPKIEGIHIKIHGNAGFFAGELGADFKQNGERGETTLEALNKKINSIMSKIKFIRPIFIYFDELEAFYHNAEQHRRDQTMVRDLLFAVSKLNDVFSQSGTSINILAAVRSEVIHAMGSLGQEVDRLVHDRGFNVSWYGANRSLKHPLMQLIARKLSASEALEEVPINSDPLTIYFPQEVNGEPIDVYLLDRSFYKPRDIVWRLSIAQSLFPNDKEFSAKILHETETEYSNKLWDEVRYELGATYSDEEVSLIERAFSGGEASFYLQNVEMRFSNVARNSRALVSLLQRRSVIDILHDLYRLGAIGNSFRAGSTGNSFRNRWSFRGDPTLLDDKRMVIHPALLKRLSVVSARRRGTRGGRNR